MGIFSRRCLIDPDEWQPEPPVDWAEVESEEAAEAREEAENGSGT